MRVTEKGQVTIPLHVREKLRIHPGDDVEFVEDDDNVVLVRSERSPDRVKQMIERLRGSGDVHMSTDEIMALTRGE